MTTRFLRFVVLHHTGVAEPHFDVMVERSPDGALRTWRASVWPMPDETSLIPLEDHRAIYLTYQGPVSGNRGDVQRVFAADVTVESDEKADGSSTIRITSNGLKLTITRRADGTVIGQTTSPPATRLRFGCG